MISILPMIGSHGGRSCSFFALASVMLVSFASACPDRPDGADESSSSSTGSASTSHAAVTSTSGTNDSSGTSGASTGGTTDGGTSDTGPIDCGANPEPIETIPPILQVSVEILNDTTEAVYVAEFVDFCTEYGLAQAGRSLPLQISYTCPCECPSPPSPNAEAVALEPGQSLVLTWDGRVMLLYQEYVFCEKDGSCALDTSSAYQPLEPGPLTMTIPIYDQAGPYEEPFGDVGLVLDRCPSPRSFSVAFELGTEDLSIPVALSEVVIR